MNVASMRKAPRRSASLMPKSSTQLSPTSNLETLLKNRDKSARNSERVKDTTEKSISSATTLDEPARR